MRFLFQAPDVGGDPTRAGRPPLPAFGGSHSLPLLSRVRRRGAKAAAAEREGDAAGGAAGTDQERGAGQPRPHEAQRGRDAQRAVPTQHALLPGQAPHREKRRVPHPAEDAER